MASIKSATALRAAFDLGSGATKMCLAMVTPTTTTTSKVEAEAAAAVNRKTTGKYDRVESILFQEEGEVLLGHAMKASPTKTIDEATIGKLFSTIERYLEIARTQHEKAFTPSSQTPTSPPLELRGVATAVYREASNGPELLQKLRDKYRINVSVVSQRDEGRIGFTTAVTASNLLATSGEAERISALTKEDKEESSDGNEKLLVWDSGGASFQITLGNTKSLEVEQCFEGPWGSSKALYAVKEIQDERLATSRKSNTAEETEDAIIKEERRRREEQLLTVNPMMPSDAEEFIKRVKANLSSDVVGGSPSWLPASSSCKVLAIGGPTCAFRMSSMSLGGRTQGITPALLRESIFEGRREGEGGSQLPPLLGLSDKELASAPFNFPQPEMVIPKICLIIAVFETLLEKKGYKSFDFCQTCGGTLGLLSIPEFWSKEQQ